VVPCRWVTNGIWTLPFDPVNRGNFVPAGKGDEWYLWAAYRTRLVGYDVLLQGQFRDSDLTYSYSGIRRLMHEGAVGLNIGFQLIQVSFSVNAKSSETRRGSADREHLWGGVNVVYRY